MAPGDVDALWLEAFGRLADAAAHEIRNPLNGALLNVEVLRQRTRRGTGELAAVAPFAELAATELSRAAELTDALLTLARPVQRPPEVWSTVIPLFTLYGAVAARAGGDIALERLDGVAGTADAPVAAIRLAVAVALQPVLRSPVSLHCTVAGGGDGVRLRVEGGELGGDFPGSVRDALATYGIVVSGTAGALSLFFPAGLGAGPL